MRILIIALLITIFLINVAHPANAQDSDKNKINYFQDSLLDKLSGCWNGSGFVHGGKVVYHISGNWTLDHNFFELNMIDTTESHEYSAKVLIGFDNAGDKYVTHWLDNFGGKFSETLGYGSKKGDTIELGFDYPDGALINRFIYNSQFKAWSFQSAINDSENKMDTLEDISVLRVQPDISDGFYIVRRIGINALQLATLNRGETVINFNEEFTENAPYGVSALVIDTNEFVPIELESPPVAEPQTPEKKLLILTLNKNQTEKLKEFTSKNIMKRVAVVIDGEAYTVHKIREAITGGKIQLTRCTDNACESLYVKLKDNVKK